MPIDFFLDNCKCGSDHAGFGLCDDLPAENEEPEPAYIDTGRPEMWIAEINNPGRKWVDFYAIDHCVVVLKDGQESESTCDGMLCYENSLFFVELKDRAYSGWLGKARKQLANTIRLSSKDRLDPFRRLEAYVCNKQRPIATVNHQIEIERFREETGGIRLNVRRIIDIT